MENRVFIRYDENMMVTFMHFLPFDLTHGMGKTEDELLSEGALVAPFVEPEVDEGKQNIPKYDRANNTVVFEVIDLPLSKEEQLRQDVSNLKLENATQEEIIAGMSYELMMLQPEQTARLYGGEHSPKFNMIKIWFNKGFWTAEMVADAVTKNVITEAEKVEILGA